MIPESTPAIEVTGLTKRYGPAGVLAVDHIDFTVPRGEVFGFLGPKCAGKTTTIRMLTGLARPPRAKRACWVSICDVTYRGSRSRWASCPKHPIFTMQVDKSSARKG